MESATAQGPMLSCCASRAWMSPPVPFYPLHNDSTRPGPAVPAPTTSPRHFRCHGASTSITSRYVSHIHIPAPSQSRSHAGYAALAFRRLRSKFWAKLPQASYYIRCDYVTDILPTPCYANTDAISPLETYTSAPLFTPASGVLDVITLTSRPIHAISLRNHIVLQLWYSSRPHTTARPPTLDDDT